MPPPQDRSSSKSQADDRHNRGSVVWVVGVDFDQHRPADEIIPGGETSSTSGFVRASMITPGRRMLSSSMSASRAVAKRPATLLASDAFT
jgi:hypothetical protein